MGQGKGSYSTWDGWTWIRCRVSANLLVRASSSSLVWGRWRSQGKGSSVFHTCCCKPPYTCGDPDYELAEKDFVTSFSGDRCFFVMTAIDVTAHRGFLGKVMRKDYAKFNVGRKRVGFVFGAGYKRTEKDLVTGSSEIGRRTLCFADGANACSAPAARPFRCLA